MNVIADIPLAPSLEVRLIALAVVEAVLLTVAVLLWVRYTQLKRVSLDEWWERRRRVGVSPRVQRMVRESHDEWLAARGQAAETAELEGGATRPSGESGDG